MEDCEECKRLERENRKLRRKIDKMRRAILRTRQFCEAIYARWLMTEAQGHRVGVPRGTWSLRKGQGQVAQNVLARLPEE